MKSSKLFWFNQALLLILIVLAAIGGLITDSDIEQMQFIIAETVLTSTMTINSTIWNKKVEVKIEEKTDEM